MADTFSEHSGEPPVPETAPVGTSRALVPLTLSAPERSFTQPAFRPDARFVAHLLATAAHAPQTRNHRRAAVEDVMTSYSNTRARDRLPVAANGAALSKVA